MLSQFISSTSEFDVNLVIDLVFIITGIVICFLDIMHINFGNNENLRSGRGIYNAAVYTQMLSCILYLIYFTNGIVLLTYISVALKVFSFFALWYYLYSGRSYYQFKLAKKDRWIFRFFVFLGLCLSTVCAFTERYHLAFDFIFSFFLAYVDIIDRILQMRTTAENEKLLRENQLSKFNLQMHSHFIYNVLMAIIDLCYTDVDKAVEMIRNFADYLRGTVKGITTDELKPFEDELYDIETYIKLVNVLHEDNIDFTKQIEEKDFLIPALSVLSLIENSVKHAAYDTGNRKVEIRLITRSVGDKIQIVVENSSDKKGKDDKNTGLGVALKIIDENIRILCNGTFEMEYLDDMTRAVIEIPKEKV